jgi:hypothetical protein
VSTADFLEEPSLCSILLWAGRSQRRRLDRLNEGPRALSGTGTDLTNQAKDGLYNLLVAAKGGAWDRQEAVLDAKRFLELTDDDLHKRFQALDDRAIGELKTLPTLFAYETSVGANARVGWITEILPVSGRVQITFKFDASIAPVTPDRILDLRWRLQIGEWQMNRTHWAVKKAHLLDVLRKGTATVAAAKASRGEYSFSRQTILRACDILGSLLSHGELDRFLLEVGIHDINAGKDRGSKVQRTTAIAEYVFSHPDAQTVEGEGLALVVVRRAAKADPDYPAERYGIDVTTRTGFWNGLQLDGYSFASGGIVATVEEEGPTAPPYATAAAGRSAVSSPVPALIVRKTSTRMNTVKPKIFIVHGRDNGAKYEVAHFLQQLELEPVILHERPNAGRTLISKFQEESADIHFAVVLMTPDDIGNLAGSPTPNPRARQNVIFELGFFIGKLGAGKVCALVSGGVERPSDFEAIVYVEYGAGTTWKSELARELRHAEIKFDPNRVF